MKLTNIFFTSDWHIGQANCIVFDKRPFKGLDDMHHSLITRYNSVVKKNTDVCYFLGDTAVGNIETCRSVISRLNGFKICILGNHDRGLISMKNLGFDAVLYNACFYIGDIQVTMSHCPKMGAYREYTESGENWHKESKFSRFSVPELGQFHLHGHIHSPNNGKSQKILNRQFDVGVVANNYSPVSIGTIQAWINKSLKKV